MNTNFYSYSIAQYSTNGFGNAITTMGGTFDVQYSTPTPIRISPQGNIIFGGGFLCTTLLINNFGSTLPNTSSQVSLTNSSLGTTGMNAVLFVSSPTQGTLTLPDPPTNCIRYLMTSRDTLNATTITTASPIQGYNNTFSTIVLQTSGSNISLYWNGSNWSVLSKTDAYLI